MPVVGVGWVDCLWLALGEPKAIFPALAPALCARPAFPPHILGAPDFETLQAPRLSGLRTSIAAMCQLTFPPIAYAQGVSLPMNLY